MSKTPSTVVASSITYEYASKNSNTHIYELKSTYNNTRIRGTSLTLNDLLYVPSKDGHRLFVKNNIAEYDGHLRNILWYGPLDKPQSNSGKDWSTTWNNTWNDKLDCNRLYLYTGPSFIPDKL